MNDIFDKSIILIGGMAVGKTTIAELLSAKLKMKVISSDAIRCDVLEKMPGYSFEKQLQIRKEKGFIGEMNYLIPYSNIAIEKILDELTIPSIIDIGAFFPNQINDKLIKKIKQFKNIIFLCPNKKNDMLMRRNIDSNSEIGKIYMQTLNNPIYESLATQIVKIDGLTPEEITTQILD